MPNCCEHSHTRRIVQQKPNDRFFKVEKGELIDQEHISANITLYKGVYAISNDQQSDSSKDCFALL